MQPMVCSVKDARQMLGGVSHGTIYSWMREGKIEGLRIGGRRLIKVASIRRALGEEVVA